MRIPVVGGLVGREIEVKYRVADGDVGAVIARLEALGVELGEPVIEDDQAYAPQGWRWRDDRIGVVFARLRTVDGDRHTLTVKRPLTSVHDCEEHEFGVDDRAEAHGALTAMGFCPTVRICKSRRTGAASSGVRVCLDRLEDVGWFVEFEWVGDAEAVAAETVRAQLQALATEAGLRRSALEPRGYDTLVRANEESIEFEQALEST